MKHIKLYFLIAISSMLMISSRCFAQDVNAFATINKDSIYAGQPIDYNLRINLPNGYIIDWTSINDTIGSNIEILDKGEITEATVDEGNDITISRLLKLTTFDTGYVEIPRVNLKYTRSTDDTNTYELKTNPIDIYVQGVSIDTTVAYRDIKLPIKQNFTFEESIPYIGGVLILAGIITLILLLIKHFRRKENKDEEDDKPIIPAIIIARERLSQLKDANLWQNGKLKEFYTDLTDIVREYLEGQFNIEAIEMTSDEIMTEVKMIDFDSNTISKLQDTLHTADLVKFAKASTSPTQNEESFNNINTFIEDSYVSYQELEKKKAEEVEAKRYDFEDSLTEKQEMEETK